MDSFQSDSTTNEHTATEFRPRPGVRRFGIAFACFYGCVTVAYLTLPWLLKVSPRGPAADIALSAMGAAVFGSMFLLSLYLAAAGHLARIRIDGWWLTLKGPLRVQTIHVRDVTRVAWRNRDAVTLYTGKRRASAEFGAYSIADAGEIVKFIRCNVPAERQDGWHPFFAARMRGKYDRVQRHYLVHPHARRPPQEENLGRLLTVTLGTGVLGGLACGALLKWGVPLAYDAAAPSFSGSHLLDGLLAGLGAAVPLALLVGLTVWEARPQASN